LPYVHALVINQKKKTLTLDEFIASVYDAQGKHKAGGIVRPAVKAHLVGICGQQRFVIS